MATITAGDFRNGKTFEMDGKIYQVVEFQHVKPGKGAAFVRTKMRNIITGGVTETSFNPTAKFEEAFIERKKMEYSYNDGDLYYFMDQETYDMIPLSKDLLPEAFRFIKENEVCTVLSHKGSVFGLEGFASAFEMNPVQLILERSKLSVILDGCKEVINITDHLIVAADITLHQLKLNPGVGQPDCQIFHSGNAGLFHQNDHLGHILQISDAGLFTGILTPALSACFAHGPVAEDHISQGMSLRILQHFLVVDRCHQLCDLITQLLCCPLQGTEHPVDAENLTVLFTHFRDGAFPLHGSCGGAEMPLRQTVFNTLSLQRTHVDPLRSARSFKGSVLHHFPVVPPDLSVLVIVPVNGIDVADFPFAIPALDALAVFIQHIFCPGLVKPLAMLVHGPEGQQKMNMGITVAFVMIVQVTDHAFADKLLLAVVPDQSQVLLISQLLRKNDEHPSGSLGILPFLDSVHRIPECLTVSIFPGSVVRQHDFPINDTLRAAVGMLPFMITLGVHLLSGVIGRSSHNGLIFAAYIRYGKRGTGDLAFTSVSQRRAL